MSTNEFISAPFISHDGRDRKGVRAEVKVQIGNALVAEMKKPSNRKSSMVQFGFSAPSSKYPVFGWLNKDTDAELYNKLKEAYDDEKVLAFRIEVQRKGNVDRALTFDEIAPKNDKEAAFENTFRNIVAVKEGDDEDWTVGTKMITSFKEDGMDIDNPHGNFKATDDDIFDDEVTNTPAVKTPAKSSQSYGVRNKDGSVNINSFAVMAPSNMIFFIKNYLNTNLEENVFSADEERTIAKGLMKVANSVQKHIANDEDYTVDIGSYSYRFAEEVVRGVVQNYMPLKEFNDDFDSELELYLKKVTLVARKIAKWSIDTVDELNG